MAGKSWFKEKRKFRIKFYDSNNNLVTFKMPYYGRYKEILVKYPAIKAAWVDTLDAEGSLVSNVRVK